MPRPDDLARFFVFDEFASHATWGDLETAVIFDAPTEEILGGRGLSNEYTALLPAVEFPGIARGDSVAIDGISYTLRENPRLVEDGALKRITLTKA